MFPIIEYNINGTQNLFCVSHKQMHNILKKLQGFFQSNSRQLELR